MEQKMLPGDAVKPLARQSVFRRGPSQDGFSLVEIVIAMLLFALVAVAVLPLIISVTQLTVSNSESVRAKALVQQKLASIQRDYPTNPAAGLTLNCASLRANVSSASYAPADGAINGLTLTTTAGACPSAGRPGVISLRFHVTNAGGGTVADVHTSVRVTQ